MSTSESEHPVSVVLVCFAPSLWAEIVWQWKDLGVGISPRECKMDDLSFGNGIPIQLRVLQGDTSPTG